MFALTVAVGCLAPSRGRAAIEGAVTWFIFVDDLHIDFRDTGYLRNLLTSIATELIREGDSFAVRSSGPSLGSLALTTNGTALRDAIRKVTGSGFRPAVGSPQMREVDDDARLRASLAGSAAIEMLGGATAAGSGRAALLYLSNGYRLDPANTWVARLASATARSHVTVFALNLRGLRGSPASTVDGDERLSTQYRAEMLNSLRALSEPTGGFAVLEKADFADALQRIERAMR